MTNMTTCGFVLWAVPRFRRDATLKRHTTTLTDRTDYVETFTAPPAVGDRTREPVGIVLPTQPEHLKQDHSKN